VARARGARRRPGESRRAGSCSVALTAPCSATGAAAPGHRYRPRGRSAAAAEHGGRCEQRGGGGAGAPPPGAQLEASGTGHAATSTARRPRPGRPAKNPVISGKNTQIRVLPLQPSCSLLGARQRQADQTSGNGRTSCWANSTATPWKATSFSASPSANPQAYEGSLFAAGPYPRSCVHLGLTRSPRARARTPPAASPPRPVPPLRRRGDETGPAPRSVVASRRANLIAGPSPKLSTGEASAVAPIPVEAPARSGGVSSGSRAVARAPR
jgi:hypothetical protein